MIVFSFLLMVHVSETLKHSLFVCPVVCCLITASEPNMARCSSCCRCCEEVRWSLARRGVVTVSCLQSSYILKTAHQNRCVMLGIARHPFLVGRGNV